MLINFSNRTETPLISEIAEDSTNENLSEEELAASPLQEPAFSSEEELPPASESYHPGVGDYVQDAVSSWAEMFTTQFSWASARRHYGQMIVQTVEDRVASLKETATSIATCCYCKRADSLLDD